MGVCGVRVLTCVGSGGLPSFATLLFTLLLLPLGVELVPFRGEGPRGSAVGVVLAVSAGVDGVLAASGLTKRAALAGGFVLGGGGGCFKLRAELMDASGSRHTQADHSDQTSCAASISPAGRGAAPDKLDEFRSAAPVSSVGASRSRSSLLLPLSPSSSLISADLSGKNARGGCTACAWPCGPTTKLPADDSWLPAVPAAPVMDPAEPMRFARLGVVWPLTPVLMLAATRGDSCNAATPLQTRNAQRGHCYMLRLSASWVAASKQKTSTQACQGPNNAEGNSEPGNQRESKEPKGNTRMQG